jgi:hypothetical protein
MSVLDDPLSLSKKMVGPKLLSFKPDIQRKGRS